MGELSDGRLRRGPGRVTLCRLLIDGCGWSYSSDGKAAYSDTPFVVEVPRLLAERGMSVSALARLVGVGQPYLSRVINGKDSKVPAGDLPRRVALALDLPEDYFFEARKGLVLEQITADVDTALTERLYRRFRSEEAR